MNTVVFIKDDIRFIFMKSILIKYDDVCVGTLLGKGVLKRGLIAVLVTANYDITLK